MTPSLLLSCVIFWLTPSPPVLYSILSYNLHPLLFEKTQYFQAFVNPMIEINSITKSLFNIFSFVKLINICNSSPNHTVSCLLTYMWEGFLILGASNLQQYVGNSGNRLNLAVLKISIFVIFLNFKVFHIDITLNSKMFFVAKVLI